MLCQAPLEAEPPASPSKSDNETATLRLDFAWQLERDAARLARGLACERSWAEVAKQAQQLVREAAHWPSPVRAGWSDDTAHEPKTAALQSAARALDGFSQRATSGGQEAREAGLWSAAAFALGGNFPSASVVLKRTFPRLNARPGSLGLSSSRPWPGGVAALIAAFSPALAPTLAGHSPFAARALKFDDDEIFDQLELEAGAAWPQFLALARASFEGARDLSTLAALDQHGGALSGHKWSEHLAARVPLLLPPQMVAIGRGLLESEDNAVAALPPGTGKTWLGELWLFERLARAERSGTQGAPLAVFLVPYVALGRGVFAAIKKHAPNGVEVRAWLGGEDGEVEVPTGAAIIVATPERFDGAWRAEPLLSERLCGAVVDEAHLMGDGARGARLETLVARLRLAKVRALFLSAATQNPSDFGAFVGAPAHFQLSGSWTPTARRLAIWRQDGLEWWGELAGQGLVQLGSSPLPWPRRELRASENWVTQQKQEGLVWSNVAHLVRARHDELGGAVLCLCATRRGARQLARALASVSVEGGEPGGARAQALSLIETRYRTLLPLGRLLRAGVAWHSAALPSDLRALIERAVSEGELWALASTRTLAEGVDLPFNQTVLADWLSWDERGWHPMDAGLFRNIAGRCGRAGAFTEGDTFVFDNPLGPSKWTAPDVRGAVQHAQFLEPNLSPKLSALEGEEISAPVRAAWESGLTALLAWHHCARGPLGGEGLKGAFGLAQLNPSAWERAITPVFDAWETGDFARVDAQGKWHITARGELLARSDVSGQTALRLVDALASLPRRAPQTSDDAAQLNALLWHALDGVAEASETASVWAPRSKFSVRPGDLSLVGREWLEGASLAHTFALLPRARESKAFPGEEHLRAWLDGENAGGQKMDEADADWTAQYDRFGDWTRSALGSWTARLWRACGALAPLALSRPDVQKWEWNRFAARWASGVPSDWAVVAGRLRAPGGRETLAIWGRHWPFAPTSADSLGLGFVARDEAGAIERAETAFGLALREAGGPFCAQGQSVQALKDWLWARAGASK